MRPTSKIARVVGLGSIYNRLNLRGNGGPILVEVRNWQHECLRSRIRERGRQDAPLWEHNCQKLCLIEASDCPGTQAIPTGRSSGSSRGNRIRC
jgi:hypothetical protein